MSLLSGLRASRDFLRARITKHYSVLTRSQSENRTIFALSTPPGKGGIAVIRISGPEAHSVWRRMVKSNIKTEFPPSRVIHRCLIVDRSKDGAEEVLDDGLAVFFKAPKSFTAENVLELHLHSSPAVLRRIFQVLSCLPRIRAAERGEFTKRAYLAGRLSLLQVEGLKDLIDADTEMQRQVAMRSFTGVMDSKMEELRMGVVKPLAMIEALVDFGEGEDIEDGVYEAARQEVVRLRECIMSDLNDKRRGEIIRSGIKMSIFGPPNAGKSSLLNYLTRRDVAIVTDTPGTTRDVLETSLDIAGLPVRLLDTAGLRKTEDLVEKIGIQRARNAVAASDLSLCVLSLPEFMKDQCIPKAVSRLVTSDTLYLLNKNDLVVQSENELKHTDIVLHRNAWVVSLTTESGMKKFLSDLGRILNDRFGFRGGDIPLVMQSRHRIHLQNAVSYLDAFLSMSKDDVVLSAEELRYAAQEIGKITGRVGVEDVLDVVFQQFCIGK